MSAERRKVEWSLDLENLRARAGQFVTEMMGEPIEPKRSVLREPRSGATSATIDISFAIGKARLYALDEDADELFLARIDHVGELDYKVEGGVERTVRLRQKDSFPRDVAASISQTGELRWQIGLARGLPLRLKLNCGVGAAAINLGDLDARALELTAGLGEVALNLPGASQPITAALRCGVGKTVVSVPKSAKGSLRIEGGVGRCEARVSPEVALRLQAKRGLGKINLPARLLSVDAGLWQSDDYAGAESALDITYTGGIGNFTLRDRAAAS